MADKDISQAFSLRLKEALQRRRLKATDLARLTDVSDAKVSGWIHGKGLTLTNLIHIAEALQVSLNWLVHGIGSEQLAANGRLNPLEKDLVLALRHFGTESVDHLNRFLSRFYLASLGSSLKQFHAHNLAVDMNPPFAILDTHGKLLTANLAFNQLLRLSDEHITQAIQQEYTQWLPRHLHTPVRHLMKETLQNGHAGTKKIQITRNSNENSFFIIKSRMLDMPDIQAGCGVQMVFFPLEEK